MDFKKINNFHNKLIEKVKKKEFKIGIIGMGYVGLPLALEFCKKEVKVTAFDKNKNIIKSLKESRSYINHISSKELSEYNQNKLLKTSINYNDINNVDVIIICVPTTLNKNKEPDLRFIKN